MHIGQQIGRGFCQERWVGAHMKLPIDDQAMKCFQKLGNHLNLSRMDCEELPAEVKGLEQVVCITYSSCG